MSNTNHEDAIMKMGFEYFRDSILKALGVDCEFVDTGPTELVELTITKLYMDFTFLTKDGNFVHFEFQTTDKKEADLRRFRAYEAVFSHKFGKDVTTYVIYSGGMTDALTKLKCGINVYKVQPVYLKAKAADEVIEGLVKKQAAGKLLTDEDFVELSLSPVMCEADERKDIIKSALKTAKQENSVSADKCMAILYTFADKFLIGKDLDEIREVFYMTRLGQMIFDDGVKKGKGDGMEQFSKLSEKLLDENRMDDLRRVNKDREYRDKLLKEYGIV